MLGHHQSEDGVTEELQALVGRQATLLVSVGAVGQRAVQQLGVDTHPEFGEQIAGRQPDGDRFGPDQDVMTCRRADRGPY